MRDPHDRWLSLSAFLMAFGITGLFCGLLGYKHPGNAWTPMFSNTMLALGAVLIIAGVVIYNLIGED